MGHIEAMDKSYFGFYQNASKCVCLKYWEYIDAKGLPDFQRIETWYKRLNDIILNRQKYNAQRIDEITLEIEADISILDKLYIKFRTLDDYPTTYKGDIQKLGGHTLLRIGLKGMPGIKGFYTAVRRELRDHLKQWYIAFSGEGCGSVLYNDKLLHNNVCWVCHEEYQAHTTILLHGFVAPWCSKRTCIQRVAQITPDLVKFVTERNQHIIL